MRQQTPVVLSLTVCGNVLWRPQETNTEKTNRESIQLAGSGNDVSDKSKALENQYLKRKMSISNWEQVSYSGRVQLTGGGCPCCTLGPVPMGCDFLGSSESVEVLPGGLPNLESDWKK